MIGLDAARLLVGASTWFLTWALHAMIAAAFALGAGRWLIRAPQQRGILWQTALLLPLVSATLMTAGLAPMSLRRDINVPAILRPAWPSRNEYRLERRTRRDDRQVVTRSFATDTVAVDVSAATLAAAIAFALGGLASLRRRRGVFRRRLGRRTPVDRSLVDNPMADAAFPMQLTMSATLGGPVAIGWSEVCVPCGFFEVLTDSQQHGVLRHEVAHLERHDPFWFAVADVLLALAPWQPFIRPLIRAMRRDAEFSCDDAVVVAMGDGRALVQSLAVLAGPFDLRESVVAASCNGSPLEERARRILGPPRPATRHALGWTVAAASLLLCGLALAAPAVSTRTMAAHPPAGQASRILRVTDSIITMK